MRGFIARTIRAVAILVRDGRIPKPLRWLAALGLAPIPGPFDEAVLLLVGLLLFALHREPLREAWERAAETATEPQSGAGTTSPGTRRGGCGRGSAR